ncbi:MAG: hypothetical protein ABI217_12770 [Chthoniobacterales bacterium]
MSLFREQWTRRRVALGRHHFVLLVAAVVFFSAIAGLFVVPRADANKAETAVAVLPFERFSEDKDIAFFADGIADDILTNLARVEDLKVISRTSVMASRAKSASLREIGKALGVSAIVEGSVRRMGDQVRLNVRLINVRGERPSNLGGGVRP